MSLPKRRNAAAIAFAIAILQGCAWMTPGGELSPVDQTRPSKPEGPKSCMEQAEGLIKVASEMETHGDKAEQTTWLSLYEQAAAVCGDNPGITVLLAGAYAKAGLTEKALQTYHSLLAKNPSHGAALLGLGSTYIQTGALEKGIGSLEKAAPLLNSSLAYSRLGVAYTQAGKVREARDALETAFRLAPNDLDIATNLALILALDFDYQKAVALMQKVAASPEVQDQHRQNLVFVLALAGQEDQARQAARQVFAQSDLDALLSRAARIRGLSEPKARAKALGTATPPAAAQARTLRVSAGSAEPRAE